MKQNLYDNPEFFAGYKALRDSHAGLNEVLEKPAIRSLLPDLNGKSVLELGCGTGESCRYLVDHGAGNVVGVDISNRMLEIAIKEITDDRITFVQAAIEDYDAGIADFDLVVSSLAFHYIADLSAVFRRVNVCLKSDGHLVFSMEHPIATCSQGIHPGWEKDGSGRKKYWQVDEYSSEGIRRSRWIIDGVVKYHRQLSSILNCLVASGFEIERVLEPHALAKAEKQRADLLEERRRPPFLMVRAKNRNENTEQTHSPDVLSHAGDP
jgi:SAM-dependent methyltransferase